MKWWFYLLTHSWGQALPRWFLALPTLRLHSGPILSSPTPAPSLLRYFSMWSTMLRHDEFMSVVSESVCSGNVTSDSRPCSRPVLCRLCVQSDDHALSVWSFRHTCRGSALLRYCWDISSYNKVSNFLYHWRNVCDFNSLAYYFWTCVSPNLKTFVNFNKYLNNVFSELIKSFLIGIHYKRFFF